MLLFLLSAQSIAVANEGDPMAIRGWPDGVVSLETHWGLQLVINPTPATAKQLPREADQAVHDTQQIDHVLSRLPNEAEPSWLSASEERSADPNAITVKSARLGRDSARAVVLQVDGVKIVFIPSDTFESQGDFDAAAPADVDLLILTFGELTPPADARLLSLVTSLGPKLVVLNSINAADPSAVERLRTSIGAADAMITIAHNTLAFSQTTRTSTQPRIVTLTDAPSKMPNEMEVLFAAMEKASSDSQRVFTQLSTKQMNFKPGNGTHTPRWNAEHMMGRQLLFFSRIYGAQDTSIPVMDLNPQQMPPDYVFAHPDWEGHEESRQMQRVVEFTRRFAYLLAGMDLDSKAPGSRWPSLRALLNQMHRHYSEHTANTVKKFDLPGWPKES